MEQQHFGFLKSTGTKYAPSLIFPSKILNYLRRELFCVFQFRITSNFLFDAAEISKYTILTAFF